MSGNLNGAWGGERGEGGEKRPLGKGIGRAGGGVGAVTNSLIASVISSGGRHCSSSWRILAISKGSEVLIMPAPQAKIARPLLSQS